MKEMSSISTLEVAWEHYPWGTYDHEVEEDLDETDFCIRVAETNRLELLKWAREEKKCEWDDMTIKAAARQGTLEMVKYCVANKCPIDERACGWAAFNGHLEILKYLCEEGKAKRLGILKLPLRRLKMGIFIYSNILLSVSMMDIPKWNVSLRPRTAT